MQCFREPDGSLPVTDVNTRFGGGFPLPLAAGSRYPELALALARGERPEPRLGEFEEGVYDDALLRRGLSRAGRATAPCARSKRSPIRRPIRSSRDRGRALRLACARSTSSGAAWNTASPSSRIRRSTASSRFSRRRCAACCRPTSYLDAGLRRRPLPRCARGARPVASTRGRRRHRREHSRHCAPRECVRRHRARARARATWNGFRSAMPSSTSSSRSRCSSTCSIPPRAFESSRAC